MARSPSPLILPDSLPTTSTRGMLRYIYITISTATTTEVLPRRRTLVDDLYELLLTRDSDIGTVSL